MDKAITTAMFIIVSMVLVMMLFNSAYPAVMEGSDAISNAASRAEERMRTGISLIHTAAELDSSGTWQDGNANNAFEVFAWVKNIGSSRIVGFEQMDVFFGEEGNFARIPHQTYAGTSYPYWVAQVEGGGDWIPTSTLRITVIYDAPLTSGRYFIRVTTPNGVTVHDIAGF